MKIIKWLACRNVTEARAFIGLCVYYRAWIKDFSVVAEPIFRPFRGRVILGDATTVKGGKQRKRKPAEEAEFT
jgi:hypothetical protein